MLINVITLNGPQNLQADPIPNSPDDLAIARKFDDGPYAFSVVAPVPNTDIWIGVACPHDLESSSYKPGSIRRNLEDHIAGLPSLCEQWANNQKAVNPVTIALARYLGIITQNHLEQRVALVKLERLQFDEEQNRKQAEKEQLRKRELENSFAKFKAGDLISVADFEELLFLAGIVAHPRTLGSLRKNVTAIGHTQARRTGKGQLPDGVWALAHQLFSSPLS
jgi:hypothetical protein